jgi:hypothetical protein
MPLDKKGDFSYDYKLQSFSKGKSISNENLLKMK